MDRSHTALLARALCDGKLGLKAAIELRGRQCLPIARRNQILEPRVDADIAPRFGAVGRLGHWLSNACIQVPTAASVFAEVTGANLVRGKTITVPQRQPPAGELDLAMSGLNRSLLERYPTETA